MPYENMLNILAGGLRTKPTYDYMESNLNALRYLGGMQEIQTLPEKLALERERVGIAREQADINRGHLGLQRDIFEESKESKPDKQYAQWYDSINEEMPNIDLSNWNKYRSRAPKKYREDIPTAEEFMESMARGGMLVPEADPNEIFKKQILPRYVGLSQKNKERLLQVQEQEATAKLMQAMREGRAEGPYTDIGKAEFDRLQFQKSGYPPDHPVIAALDETIRGLRRGKKTPAKDIKMTDKGWSVFFDEEDLIHKASNGQAVENYLPSKHGQILERPPVRVNITQKGFSKASEELGSQIAKEFKDVEQAALSLQELEQAENLLASGMVTGAGADYLLTFGKALQQAGITLGKDAMSNTEAFASLMGNQTARVIKQFGSGTGLSDADREYAEKIAGGKISLNKDSIEKIITLNKKGILNVIRNHNNKVKQMKTREDYKDLPYDLEVPLPKVMVRRGVLNGKRVVEYSDGSLAYVK